MANNQLSPLCILFVWFQCFCFFSIVHGDTNASPPVPTPINRHLYHSSEDLLEEIRALVNRHPDKLTLDSLKGRNQGYSAEIDVVTYRYRRQEEADDKQRFRILISFGQHGRELVTSEVALRILSILSEEKFLPDVDKASVDRTLENLVIKVVPMENLNGRRLVEAKDLCDRRNGRGVDLNRNWSVDWGKKEKDYDPYEENPGTAPFSEPEAQIMRKIAVSFDPHIWVNVHSGMEALFMPYDHKNTTPDGVPSIKMKSLLEELNRLHCHNHCMIGSGGGSVGYLAHGTATDFMYDIVKVPMAFTFEIYGDDTVASRDCFKMFNPTDVDTFNKVLHEWSAAFFTMFKLGPNLLGANYSKASNPARYKRMSTDEYLDGYLVESSSRYGMKTKVLDLGMQDIRTYFRLFLLSSVLLLFMFCSKILKNKSSRPNVTGTPL